MGASAHGFRITGKTGSPKRDRSRLGSRARATYSKPCVVGPARASAFWGEIVTGARGRGNGFLRRAAAFLPRDTAKSVSDLTYRGHGVIINFMVGPALRYPRSKSVAGLGPDGCPSSAAVERHIGKGDMMKSVMAVENGKERRKGFRLCVFTFALGLCLGALLLTGCSTRQPGETAAEVHRRHERAMRLNTQMMMSDIDRFLLLEQPSMLTNRRIP